MGLFSKGGKTTSQISQLSGALKGKQLESEILIQSISDGIIVTDITGKITMYNNAAAKMTDWAVEEALGIDARPVLKLIADEKTSEVFADANHPFTKVLTEHKPFNQTLQLVSRNNKRVFISLVISPVVLPKDNELTGAIAVFRDVSIEHSQEKRSADFISTASHEMRTPVAAIEGYLALAMNENVSKIDPKAREFLEKAHSSTQHLGKLFQDLLTSAKAEDGRLTNHPVVTEMGGFIEQLAEDLRFSAEKKSLSVEFVHGTAGSGQEKVIDTSTGGVSSVGKTVMPLYYVHVDPDRIREVITNVFDNAVKYTEAGKVSIGITGNDRVVQIQVADTGPGIPADDVPHLFQKFYRVDNSATRTIGGTGLGLYICKAIVELYHGTIWAESTLGKGSTFFINLPRLTSQQAAHLQAEEKPASAIG